MNIFLLALFLPFLLAASQIDFTKGYLYSKLEDRFCTQEIEFDVTSESIVIYSWPSHLDGCIIKEFLESESELPVVFEKSPEVSESIGEHDLLPQLSPFFPTMLAEPHMLGYSAGYRTYDRVFKLAVLPVSIGDQFSLYQFKTVKYGHLYFGMEASVWAIFEARAKSLSLINADYYVAFPFTYFNDPFAARLRVYHQSSHLGDEYLLENDICRLNPSMEVIDLTLSYDFYPNFTGFLGYGFVMRSDDSYKVKPNHLFYGFNYFFDYLKVCIFKGEATPYFAAFFQNDENNNWGLDSTFALGYQWNKACGHKLRAFIEAHEGYEPEGQFSKKKTRYFAIKIMYGY
ncbi:MAG: DUF1207 domain-containing protein [Parachlamydiaceae bacterium]